MLTYVIIIFIYYYIKKELGICGVKSASMGYNRLAFISTSKDFRNAIKDVFKEALI